MFEDSAYALRTARGAGFLTVGIRDEISAEEPGADFSQLCHRYLPDYAQLLAELTPPEEEGSLLRAVRKEPDRVSDCGGAAAAERSF